MEVLFRIIGLNWSTFKKTNFRERYDAAIIGVQREGKHLKGKLAE